MAHELPHYLYARAKLNRAVRILATRHGTLRPRLMAAYRSFSHLMESDLPLSLRAELRGINDTLTCRPATRRFIPGDDMNPPEAGRLGATVMHMRISKLVAVAGRIFDLAEELEAIGVREEKLSLTQDRKKRTPSPLPTRRRTRRAATIGQE